MSKLLVPSDAVYTATFEQHKTAPEFTVVTPDTSELETGDIIFFHKIVGSTEEGTAESEKPSAVFQGGGKLVTQDDYGQPVDPPQYAYGIGTQFIVKGVGDSGTTFKLVGDFDTLGDNSKRTIEFHRKRPMEAGTFSTETEVFYEETPDPAVPEEAPVPDGWGRWTMATGGSLIEIAEKAATLAEELKSSVALASAAMTAVKWIAELSAANLYAALLNKLADQMLAAISDLKNAGYWYLLVDPYLTKNVDAEPPKKLGWKYLRDSSGRRIWWKPKGHRISETEFILPEDTTCSDGSARMEELLGRPVNGKGNNCPNENEVMRGGWEPKLVWPRKVVRGGYNPHDGWLIDAFETMSPFPQYNAKKVVKTMISSLQDEGDVPRYEPLPISKETSPKAGDVVFDYDGNPVMGWDPINVKTYGQELYNIGAKKLNGSEHTAEDKKDGEWKNTRKKITLQKNVGRPLIDGSTIDFSAFKKEGGSFSIEGFKDHGGMTKESYSSPCSALVFIVGAISFEHFTTSFNNFSNLFRDLDALGGGMMDSLQEVYNKLILPEPYTLRLTMCDQNYGLFTTGDVIAGNIGGLAEIVSVNSEATLATSMVSTIRTTQTDDVGEVRQRFKEVDTNSNGRYMDMEVSVLPISNPENEGTETFIVNDTVFEQEKTGRRNAGAASKGASDTESPIAYQTKGAGDILKASQSQQRHEGNMAAVTQEQKAEATETLWTQEKTVKDGAKRVYPKYGVVAMEKLVIPRESVKPDFHGIAIGQMFPMWNQVFEYIEGYINQVKGFITTNTQFIQDQIDSINGWLGFLDDLVETILEFLKFFETDLSNSGIYSLHISNNTNGTAGIVKELQSATGLPENLDYSMGIMFVGNGDSGPLLDTFFADRAAGDGTTIKYGATQSDEAGGQRDEGGQYEGRA